MNAGINLSQETIRKIDALCASWDTTKTEVITIAVDRLYQHERVIPTPEGTRPLTAEEMFAFPGDAPVNVAVREYDKWYYGQTKLVWGPDGFHEEEAVVVSHNDCPVRVR